MWDNYRVIRAFSNKLLLLAFFLLLFAAGYWVVHSTIFPVRTLYIRTNMQKVTGEQLRYIAEHELEGTFFTLNIDKTRTAFEKLPWVKEAQVRRRWPDGLEINVTEHEAIARWGENGLIDSDGDWFDAASDQKLPVLIGPERSEKLLATMLPKFSQWVAPSGLSLIKVELLPRAAWRVELSNKMWLELGRGSEILLKQRLMRFAAYWQDVQKSVNGNGIHHIDMRYSNGFSVMLGSPSGDIREDI